MWPTAECLEESVSIHDTREILNDAYIIVVGVRGAVLECDCRVCSRVNAAKAARASKIPFPVVFGLSFECLFIEHIVVQCVGVLQCTELIPGG